MQEIKKYGIGGSIQFQFSYKIPGTATCTCGNTRDYDLVHQFLSSVKGKQAIKKGLNLTVKSRMVHICSASCNFGIFPNREFRSGPIN
jgi:hypothetical protein